MAVCLLFFRLEGGGYAAIIDHQGSKTGSRFARRKYLTYHKFLHCLYILRNYVFNQTTEAR